MTALVSAEFMPEVPPATPDPKLELPLPLSHIEVAPHPSSIKRLSECLRVGMHVRDHTGLVHRIVWFVKHGDTGEVMVVHRAASNCDHDGFTWVRARTCFDELVDVGGVMLPRFTEAANQPLGFKQGRRKHCQVR